MRDLAGSRGGTKGGQGVKSMCLGRGRGRTQQQKRLFVPPRGTAGAYANQPPILNGSMHQRALIWELPFPGFLEGK